MRRRRCGGGEYVNEYDPMTVGLLTSYFSTGLARRGLTQTEPCYIYMNMCTSY